MLFTTPQPALELLRQLHRSGFSGRIYLGLNLADSRLLQSVGTYAMEGVSMLTVHPLSSQREDSGIQLHYALLKEYAPELEMSRWTIYGHAVAELMVEILFRSGSGLTRKQVIETAEQLDQMARTAQSSHHSQLSKSSSNHSIESGTSKIGEF